VDPKLTGCQYLDCFLWHCRELPVPWQHAVVSPCLLLTMRHFPRSSGDPTVKPGTPVGQWQSLWDSEKHVNEVRLWDLGFQRRFMLTLWSRVKCHYVIWNTGIMSSRISSSIFREKEVWLSHYMQHIRKAIFFKTLPPSPLLLPVYYHPNLFQKMISTTLALAWLWQSILCENRSYSICFSDSPLLCSCRLYWGADKSLARPTSRCILFDG
jgi:hypothetical protein